MKLKKQKRMFFLKGLLMLYYWNKKKGQKNVPKSGIASVWE